MAGPTSSETRWGAAAVLMGALAALGVALWVGGALAARDTADTAGSPRGPSVSSSTRPPSTATTSTTAASTTTTVPVTTTTTAPPLPAADGKLEHGEAGDAVVALQARLNELGYWHGTSDGNYGQLTRQAVMAFQKAEGLNRDGVAGPATMTALGTAIRPGPREPAGTHVEVDLTRQILLVVKDGQTAWVLNTSTGNGEAYAAPGGGTAVATTPTGRFSFERQIDGIREAPLGTLYRPKYFRGGFAVHGAGEVPARPASHGCVRVTNPAMDLLWSSGAAELGTPVLVYG